MAKVKSELTSEKIASKKAELEAKINNSIEAKKMGRVSPAKKFLNEVQDLVKKAIESGVSYKQLSKDIFDIYNFKVSEQTIRSFAHNVLGVEKQTRKINKNVIKATTSTTSVEDKVNKKEQSSGRIKADINDI